MAVCVCTRARVRVWARSLQVAYTLDTYRLCMWLQQNGTLPVARGAGQLQLGRLYKRATGTVLDNTRDALAHVRANAAILKWNLMCPHRLNRLVKWVDIARDESVRIEAQQAARLVKQRGLLDDSDDEAWDSMWDADDAVDRDEVQDWVPTDPDPRPSLSHRAQVNSGHPRRADGVTSPWAVFKYLWSEPVTIDGVQTTPETILVEQTNLYARLKRSAPIIKRFLAWCAWRRCGLANRAPMRYKLALVGPSSYRFIDQRPTPCSWKRVTLREMRTFIALLLAPSVIATGTSTSTIWSEWPPHLTTQAWAELMPRKRFEQIWRYLHLADPRRQPANTEPRHDPLFKVRNFLDAVQLRWRFAYTCGRFVSIDESTIKLPKMTERECRHVGLKTSVCCDGESYYVSAVDYKASKYDDKGSGIYEGTRVAMNLLQKSNLLESNRIVVTANFYTSVQLFSALREKKTHGVGFLGEERVPLGAKFDGAAHQRGYQRMVHSPSTNLAVTGWNDNWVVYFLSSVACEDDAVREAVLRWSRVHRYRLVAKYPDVVELYELSMSDLDAKDEPIEAVPVMAGLHLGKWWHQVFFHQLDLTLHNARIVYHAKMAEHGETLSNLRFREEVLRGAYDELTAWHTSPAHTPPPRPAAGTDVRTGIWARRHEEGLPAPQACDGHVACSGGLTDVWVKGGNNQRTRQRRTCQVCAVEYPRQPPAKKRCTTLCTVHGPMHVAVPKHAAPDHPSCFNLFHKDPGKYVAAAKRRLPKSSSNEA